MQNGSVGRWGFCIHKVCSSSMPGSATAGADADAVERLLLLLLLQ